MYRRSKELPAIGIIRKNQKPNKTEEKEVACQQFNMDIKKISPCKARLK